jgi:transposase
LGEYYTNCQNAKDMYEQKLENERYKQENYINYKQKDITKPYISFKEKKDSQSINIDKRAIKFTGGILKVYPTSLGNGSIKICTKQNKRDKKLQKIKNVTINHDAKLIKTETDKYYICFAIDCEEKEKQEIKKVVAIDTNIRNLGTSYSENESYEFGADIYETIIPMINKKEKLKRKHNKNIKKIIKEEITKEEYNKTRNMYLKQEELIKNKIRDMHYKVIAKLMDAEYTLILIPKLNIKQMIERDETPRIVKKIATIESHMKFIQRLIETCQIKGVVIRIVNENMTTQCCGKCYGTKKFRGEIYECEKCGQVVGRDINSARNIYIKEIGKMTEIIKYLKEI